jgi:hypothetical protein
VKKRIDVEEVERTVDFESVGQKLEMLAESGELKRRKTVADLLDKVRPSLLKARANRVPFKALAAFLEESGIPVSEPSLRQYLNALPDAKKSRRKPMKKSAQIAASPTAEIREEQPPASSKKRPPRLAR